MKKLMMMLMLAACAAAMLTGCTVTKIEYNQNAKGETSYRIYRNGHWLKTEAEGLRGGMNRNGAFEIAVDGLKSSPSEEFNRTMQTYTSAFIQLASIAAAAYNPSASAALAAANGPAAANGTPAANGESTLNSNTPNLQLTNSNTQPAAATCTDGSCIPTPSDLPARASAQSEHPATNAAEIPIDSHATGTAGSLTND